MASPDSPGNGATVSFTGGARGPVANPHAEILTPAPTPQRPRNDPALDTSSIPAGGIITHADPAPNAYRVQTGMTGPGNGGRPPPFRIRGGG